MKLSAQWTDDCQGKKDYDGPILSISTRYWPRGGSFLVFDSNNPQLGMQGGESRPHIKPSATSSLVINHGEEDYLKLVTADFEAETEEEVKAAVEMWAQTQMDKAVMVLRAAFVDTEPADSTKEENDG
jgi:hypothetical protein